MSKYVIEDTTLTAIGDAIRSKDGTTEPILVGDFASKITAITTGGGSGSGELGYAQIGAKSTTLSNSYQFDASAYIGTEDNQKFYVVIYSEAVNYSQPCILYYDGSTFTKVFGKSSNTNYVAYKIKTDSCTVESGVITIALTGAIHLGADYASEIQLFYMKNGV